MKIGISDNIIKHYLRDVYFITDHSCAGKSTMVKMLAERCDMVFCGENYNEVFPEEKLSRWKQPALSTRTCRSISCARCRISNTIRARRFSPRS